MRKYELEIVAITDDFKSFKYKAKLLGNAAANPTIAANGILKNLCNFWRSPEMPLINCKVELKLKWTNVLFLVCSQYWK